jgi:hypothetical protein
VGSKVKEGKIMPELERFLIENIYRAIKDYDQFAFVFTHERTEYELQHSPAATRFKKIIRSEDDWFPDFPTDDFTIEIELSEMKFPVNDPGTGKISEEKIQKGVIGILKNFKHLNQPKDAEIQQAYYLIGGHPEIRLQGLELYLWGHIGGYIKKNPEYI